LLAGKRLPGSNTPANRLRNSERTWDAAGAGQNRRLSNQSGFIRYLPLYTSMSESIPFPGERFGLQLIYDILNNKIEFVN